jgi:hypothetical protein
VLDGNNVDVNHAGNHYGMYASASPATYENLTFRNFGVNSGGAGIWPIYITPVLDEPVTSRNISVLDCAFFCEINGFHQSHSIWLLDNASGLELVDCDLSTFRDITLRSCAGTIHAGNPRAALRMAGANNAVFMNIEVNDCGWDTNKAVEMDGCVGCAVVGISIAGAFDDVDGLRVRACATCLVAACTITSVGRDGIAFDAFNADLLVIDNVIHETSLSADVTYSGISVAGAAHCIEANLVRRSSDIAPQMRYGIVVQPGAEAAFDVFATNNDLLFSGVTDSFHDFGTGTITTPGNQV